MEDIWETGSGSGSYHDDSLEVIFRSDLFMFQIEEPWAGCTETGFGQNCDISISNAQAASLARFIARKINLDDYPEQTK